LTTLATAITLANAARAVTVPRRCLRPTPHKEDLDDGVLALDPPGPRAEDHGAATDQAEAFDAPFDSGRNAARAKDSRLRHAHERSLWQRVLAATLRGSTEKKCSALD